MIALDTVENIGDVALSTELLPCPFCECPYPELKWVQYSNNKYKKTEIVQAVFCPCCGVTVQQSPCGVRSLEQTWNHRKQTPNLGEKIYMAHSHVSDRLHDYKTASDLAEQRVSLNQPCLILKVVESVELVPKPQIIHKKVY